MMQKRFLILGGAVLATIFVVAFSLKTAPAAPPVNSPVLDYKNITYRVESQDITLKDGYSEIPAALGSDTKITTRYFGNEAFGDVNDDGQQDVAFLLTQQTGGSGTFYYLVAAVKTNKGWQAVGTEFLGDRIAPQSTNINNGIITVNYADRKPKESMTTEPSLGISKQFKVQGGALVEQVIITPFAVPATLQSGQRLTFDDGLVVRLISISDSRCKPGVVCVWAGELNAKLSATGGSLKESLKEFNLATTTKKTATVGGYTFTLNAAAEGQITLMVAKQQAAAGCFVGGCSAEICSDKQNAVSPCIYSETFACYKTATCARQANGQCGWTKTPALTACLAK